jgi:hypothetical protein
MYCDEDAHRYEKVANIAKPRRHSSETLDTPLHGSPPHERSTRRSWRARQKKRYFRESISVWLTPYEEVSSQARHAI